MPMKVNIYYYFLSKDFLSKTKVFSEKVKGVIVTECIREIEILIHSKRGYIVNGEGTKRLPRR